MSDFKTGDRVRITVREHKGELGTVGRVYAYLDVMTDNGDDLIMSCEEVELVKSA